MHHKQDQCKNEVHVYTLRISWCSVNKSKSFHRLGIEVKFKNRTYPVLIDLNHVPELTSMETTPNGVRIGASVSLTTLDGYLKQLVKTQPGGLKNNRPFAKQRLWLQIRLSLGLQLFWQIACALCTRSGLQTRLWSLKPNPKSKQWFREEL